MHLNFSTPSLLDEESLKALKLKVTMVSIKLYLLRTNFFIIFKTLLKICITDLNICRVVLFRFHDGKLVHIKARQNYFVSILLLFGKFRTFSLANSYRQSWNSSFCYFTRYIYIYSVPLVHSIYAVKRVYIRPFYF